MTGVVIQRVPCLSDGAMASLREDLAEAKKGEPMVVAWGYVSKALDEIVWLRAREVELQSRANDWAVRAGAADRERIKSETRVAVLKLRLADAMEQIEAIQRLNATHMARAAELEEKLADSVTDLTEMSEPAKRLRGQIEAAMAPRPMSEAPDDGRQMMGVSSEQPTPVTDDPDRILSGWCVVSVLCDSCDDSKDGAS